MKNTDVHVKKSTLETLHCITEDISLNKSTASTA